MSSSFKVLQSSCSSAVPGVVLLSCNHHSTGASSGHTIPSSLFSSSSYVLLASLDTQSSQ
jgi:hypothetical protein